MEEAIKEIAEDKETFYGAQVVDACLNLFPEQRFLLDNSVILLFPCFFFEEHKSLIFKGAKTLLNVTFSQTKRYLTRASKCYQSRPPIPHSSKRFVFS